MSMKEIRRRRSRKFVNDARRGYLHRVETRKTTEVEFKETEKCGLIGRVARFLLGMFR